MTGYVRLSVHGHLATVVIDNPLKRNAMDKSMWVAMGDIFQELATADLRCVVIRGAGDEAFGSGADIDEFESIRSGKEQAVEFARHGHRAMHAVRDCPVPTVAVITGACVGGGLELAAHCDLRIARTDSRFGVPIARLGAVLAYPELAGLINLVGPNIALEMLLEGRLFNAEEAAAKGLVNRIVAPEKFEFEVERTVERILSNAPLSARWHKQFINRLRHHPRPLSEDEMAQGYACYDTEDYQAGFRAFLDKTPPVFKGK